ncbi:MAG: CNNM domain-containing protein [Balneolaceae bacterium]|nr:CNNM domain-containing protein [Balneolaceae bacterium]
MLQEVAVYHETLNPLDISIQLLIVLLGLVFSAIFSGSEVALFSISKQIDLLEESETAGSPDQLIMRMLEKPRRLLATSF